MSGTISLEVKGYSLIFLLILSTLLSVCFIPEGFSFTRPENLFLPLIIIGAWVSKYDLKFDRPYATLIILFFVATLITSIVSLQGFAGIGYAFRIVKFFFFFVLASHAVRANVKAIDFVVKFIFLTLLAVNLIEIFNPFDFGNALVLIYTHHEETVKFNETIGSTFRLIGTSVNPNDNSVLFLVFMIYFMSAYYYNKNRHELIYILICIVVIILTQSRTTFLALMMVGLIYIVNFKFRKKTLLTVFAIIGLGFALIFFIRLNYLLQIFVTNPMEIHSLQLRFEVWKALLEMWQQKLFLGWGPIQVIPNIFKRNPDSEYLYVLASYGIIGFGPYLALLLYPIFVFWRRRKDVYHAMMGVLMPVGFGIVAVTNFGIMNVRLGTLFILCMGVSFSMLNHHYRTRNLSTKKPT